MSQCFQHCVDTCPRPTPIETSPTGYKWLNVDNEWIGFYSIRRIDEWPSDPLDNNTVCAVFTGKNGVVGLYYWTWDGDYSWELDEMFDCGYGDPSLIELISVCPDRLEAIVDGIERSFEAAPAVDIQYVGSVQDLITNPDCEGNPYCTPRPEGTTGYDPIDTITVAWIQRGSLWIIPIPEPAGHEWLEYAGIWSQVASNRYLLHPEYDKQKVPNWSGASWYVEIYPDDENPLQQHITRLVSLKGGDHTSHCCYTSFSSE